MTGVRIGAVGLALALGLAAPAWANMASPVQPGSASGEPVTLAGLRVARETLVLDLRALGQAGRPHLVTVEAEYAVVNDGGARRVPLVFTALGEAVRAAEVWLDNEPVAATRVDALDVPDAWRVAETTPALDGDALPYETDARAAAGFAFTLALAPGLHRVRVRYRVRPGSYDGGAHPNRVWQVAYSLAPARFWVGFGSLDVTVHVPRGWETAMSLPLRREGDALVATFASVPGDVLAVSARAPAPAGRLPMRGGGFALALALCAGSGWLGGRLTTRLQRSVRWAWPASVVGGVMGAAALVALTLAANGLGDSVAYGHARELAALLVVGPLAALVGTLLAQTVALRTHRRRRVRAAHTPS